MKFKNLTINHGKPVKEPGKHKLTSLADLPGKLVAAVGLAYVEGDYGDEPMTVLFFADGTWQGFVLPDEQPALTYKDK